MIVLTGRIQPPINLGPRAASQLRENKPYCPSQTWRLHTGTGEREYHAFQHVGVAQNTFGWLLDRTEYMPCSLSCAVGSISPLAPTRSLTFCIIRLMSAFKCSNKVFPHPISLYTPS